MTTQLDLGPAARRVADLVEAVPGGALHRPTPCEAYTVGDLLDHIHGAALAFAAAAKRPFAGGPWGDAAHLHPDWRARIPHDLGALVEAWRHPGAWTGTTRAGGVDLPAATAGAVALDELVLHGWDLAKAIGLPAGYDGPGLEVVHRTVARFRSSGIEGLFGPAVAVADEAPLLDRTLGLAGRDPRWQPPR